MNKENPPMKSRNGCSMNIIDNINNTMHNEIKYGYPVEFALETAKIMNDIDFKHSLIIRIIGIQPGTDECMISLIT